MKIFRKSALFILVFILSMSASIAQASDVSSDSSKVVVEIMVNSNGEDFAENIVFDDGTRLTDYDYIVEYVPAARSYALQEYFNYAAWITRGTEVSLSLDPKIDVRREVRVKDAAWAVVSSSSQGFGSHPNWRNTQVMHWQYDCHFDLAYHKDYWNIEPHRTASSYLEVLRWGCNP